MTNKSILSPYYDYSIEERFTEMKTDINLKMNFNELVDKEYKLIKLDSASSNEMTITYLYFV